MKRSGQRYAMVLAVAVLAVLCGAGLHMATDANGVVVYANNEDGNLFAINQGGTLKQKIFQQLALGAAYTPASIARDGKIYSQNAGHLFVIGN